MFGGTPPPLPATEPSAARPGYTAVPAQAPPHTAESVAAEAPADAS